ncbi:MAG: hypothetical protein U1G07_06220 [Verrucomicrobiota bacterium]
MPTSPATAHEDLALSSNLRLGRCAGRRRYLVASIRIMPPLKKKMTGLKPRVFKPNPKHSAIYGEIYPLYHLMHDAFGTTEGRASCARS